MYSPARKRRPPTPTLLCNFTDSDIKLFEERYQEGCITGDARYETWLDVYHHGTDHELSRVLFTPSSPESLSANSDDELGSATHKEYSSPVPDDEIKSPEVPVPVAKGKLERILKIPTPVAGKIGVKTRGARVLTSSDYLNEVEEKKRLKRDKEEQKEQRKRARQEKARINSAIKAAKASLRKPVKKGRGKKAAAPLLSSVSPPQHSQ